MKWHFYKTDKYTDIPAKIYHPDLIPHKEYLALIQQLKNANDASFYTQKDLTNPRMN